MKINDFINKIVGARQEDEDKRRSELILNILLFGSIVCFSIINIIRLIDIISNPLDRGLSILYTLAILFLFIFLFWLSRKGKIRLAAWLFITIYSLPMIYSFLTWGADLPAALLLSILIIVLFGILINTRLVILSALAINIFLIAVTYLQFNNSIPVVSYWRSEKHEVSDAIVYMVIILIIATVAWLFSREIRRALSRARRSEQELKEERDNLEKTVIEGTTQIREVEKEKKNQLYRLAEFGRLSSGIFHDLINPLTAVSLNLEQMQNDESRKVSGAKSCLDSAILASRRMESLIVSIKKQIQKESHLNTFSVSEEIEQIIQLLDHKTKKAKARIEFNNLKDISIYGDPVKFGQIITNLLCNAIEAYESNTDQEYKDNLIEIALKENEENIIIMVSDRGPGISPENIDKIFQPFFSTKAETGRGLGIGLSSTKNLAEKDFKGSLKVTSELNKGACFQFSFPKTYEK